MIEQLEKYVDYLKYERNYSDYTINSYESDILEFFDYLAREGLSYKKLEYSDLRFYLMYLKVRSIPIRIFRPRRFDEKQYCLSNSLQRSCLKYRHCSSRSRQRLIKVIMKQEKLKCGFS